MANRNNLKYNDLTDNTLVEMIRTSNEGAFQEIYNRYHLRMFKIAFGILNDEALCKDLVQEVFIDLWNRRHVSGILSLSHYLVRAIKFQVLKQLRNGKLHDKHIQMMQKVHFVNQTEEALNLKEMELVIQNALKKIPERCREVFYLSRFDNLPNKTIAMKLNISQKTVESHISKALALLRNYFQKIISLILFIYFF